MWCGTPARRERVDPTVSGGAYRRAWGATVEATLLLKGQGGATVRGGWQSNFAVTRQRPASKRKVDTGGGTIGGGGAIAGCWWKAGWKYGPCGS